MNICISFFTLLIPILANKILKVSLSTYSAFVLRAYEALHARTAPALTSHAGFLGDDTHLYFT